MIETWAYKLFRKQGARGRAFALVSYLSALILTACSGGDPYAWTGTQNSITGMVAPLNPVVSLASGMSRRLSSASLGPNLACPTATANLYALDAAGERVQPPLQSVPVKADGTYTFTNIRRNGVTVRKINQLPDATYVAEVVGCNTGYARILTATDKQDITWGSTLVAYVTGTANATSAVGMSPAKLESLYSALKTETDFPSAYSALSTNPVLSNQFQQNFGAAPAVLEDASPMLVEINVPAQMREGDTTLLSLNAVQWNASYTRGYRWEVDGVPLSHASSYSYTPSANAQGNHTLTVSWGHSDGTGDIDPLKPYRQRSFPLVIEDNLKATPPAFSAVPPYVNSTNVNLRLSTGAALSQCASFSGLAITEDYPVAPANPAAYTITCAQSPTQDIAYSLQGAVGDHLIYLWAIDASGNISATPTTALVRYDNAVPTIAIASPTALSAPFQSNVTVTGTCDTLSGDITFTGDTTPAGALVTCAAGSFSHTFTLSAGDGSKTITAAQTNIYGTTGTASVTVTKDATPPTVMLATIAPNVTNSAAIPITVTFSESVTGFTAASVLATNGTISAFTGSGSSYSFTVTAAAQGPVTVALPNGAGLDAAGNQSVVSSTLSRTYDSISPNALIATTAPNPTQLSSVPITLTFSESVTGLSAAGITVTNGTVSGLSGSGTSYSFNVAPTAQGPFTVTVNAGAAADAATNPNAISNTVSRNFDNVRPSVILATTAPDPTNTTPIPVSATFSESVSGFSLSSLTLVNATAANLVGTGASYTFDLIPAGQGLVSATVNANVAQDPALNSNTASNTLSRTFDSAAPTTILATTAPAYANTSPFAMTITFSKPVTGLTLSDLAITNGVASALAGSGASYTFTLTPSAQGNVIARVVAAAAQDTAANQSGVSNDITIVYDTVAPTLAIAVPTAGAFVNAANVAAFPVSGTCSENGQNVNLAVGAVTKAAACSANAFSTTMDLSSLADGPLSLTANLSDLATNAAPVQTVAIMKDVSAPTATLSGMPASPSNTTTLNITVAGAGVTAYRFKVGAAGVTDCTVAAGYSAETPVATLITSSITGIADGSVTVCVVGRDAANNYQAFATPTSASWMKDTAITPVTGLAVAPASPGNTPTPTVSGSTEAGATIALYKAATCGGGSIATGTTNGSGAFSVIPSASIGADGAYTFSVRATDAAGNSVCSSSLAYTLDTANPTVILASTAPSPTNVSPIPVTVTFSESVTGFSAAGLAIVNGTASAFTGAGTSYSFSITPTGQGTVSVTVNAAAAKDASLNDNVASATLSRIYDSIAPAFTIVSPVIGGGTNQNHLIFTGACEGSLPIPISGSGVSSPASATCSSGAYSVDIFFTAGDGIKNVSMSQTDLAGNITTVTRAVPVDSVPPGLTFTSAAVKDQITNSNTVIFSGSCETGTNITVAGGTDTGSIPCPGTVWNYTTATQSTDAIRTYTFNQTDPGGNSVTISGTWKRDTVAPGLTRTAPANGTRAKDSVTITGACEIGYDIFFAGAGILSPLQIACTTGTYSQSAFFSAGDGTKAITIQQTDNANNVATINASFERDNAPPLLTQTLVASPYWTNTNSATFGGACEAGLTISITRDGSAESTTPCAAGTWSYTVASQTTDATRTYAFTQTDTATNATTVSAQWIRRTTNPAFAFTSASSFSNSSNTATFYGTCMTGVNVTVTGADSASTACSGGNWSYTTAVQSTDATRTYNFRQTDPAGNYTAIVGTWTRNTNLPQLTLATTTPFYSNGNSTSFNGGCSNGIAITVSGAATGSISCTSGTWTYPASQGADGSYTYTFNQTDTFGNSTTVNMNWVRDTTGPSITALSLNSGAAVTNSSYVKVGLTGSDSFTKVMKFCLKTSAGAPTAGDGCWIPVTANPPGLTPALTINMSNFNYLLGITPGVYSVYAWLQDAAGNISANAASVGVDRANIDYQIIYPPTLDTVFATNTNSPSFPVPSPQLSVGAGGYIYIKWRATSSGTFGATPITLSFTTNDSTWNSIATVANASSTGCTLNTSSADAATTGCYRWSAPSSSFMRLKIEATDTGGRSIAVTPPPLNTGTFKHLAGNVEPGTNSSTLSGVHLLRKQDYNWQEPNAFVITSSGVMFINDHQRGILTVDPADGLTKIFIPKTGVSSADGPVSAATVRNVYGIALDYNDRLLVWDNDRIRRVDLATSTVTRIIGGGTGANTTGTVTAASITNALDLQFQGYMPLPVNADTEYVWRTNRVAMVPLPNGDLYFGSRLDPWIDAQYAFRRYQETGNPQITTMYPTGYGHSGGTGVNVANCALLSFGFEFNTATSAIDTVDMSALDHGSSTTTYCMPDGSRAPLYQLHAYETQLDGNWQTKAIQPPNGEVANAWANYQRITGRNGKLYALRRDTGRVYLHDSASNVWNMIIGTGTNGECADGTAALSCNIDPLDLFVTAQNQIFLLDKGRIRTLDSSNRLITIFGQALSSGDGGDPILARFTKLWSIAVENDGRLMMWDFNSIRELSANRASLSRIAGNGISNWTRDGATAATSSVMSPNDWQKGVLALDPATNDVFMTGLGAGDIQVINRLNRSTGVWQRAVGGGGTNYFSGDGLVGSALRLGVWGSGTDSWIDGYIPIGFANGKLVTAHSQYPEPNPDWGNSMVKLFNPADSYRQSHLIGKPGLKSGGGNIFCANGGDVNNCDIPLMYVMNRAQYDSVDGKWLLTGNRSGDSASTRIISVPDNLGNAAARSVSTLVTLPRAPANFAYWRTGGHEYIYYCSTAGLLYRYDVNSATETNLALPSTALKCSPETSLDLDRANSVLYFNFEKNKLQGVGAIDAI